MTGSLQKKTTSAIVSPEDWNRAKDVLTVAAGLEGKERTRLVETHFLEEPTLLDMMLSLLEAHDRIKSVVDTAEIAKSPEPRNSPTTPETAPAEEAIRIGAMYGPYQVVRLIGAGGMGQV